MTENAQNYGHVLSSGGFWHGHSFMVPSNSSQYEYRLQRTENASKIFHLFKLVTCSPVS